MDIIEMLINDLIAKFAERGYRVKANYCFYDDGDLASVELEFCGRLE